MLPLKSFSIASILPILLAASSASAEPVAKPDVQLTLSRQADGWDADFVFAEPSPVWLFRRTADGLDGIDWRVRTFAVETPGVHLARVGNFDALFRTDNRPIGSVRIRITPYSSPLQHDYLPVMSFSDGGLAFYTGHFAVLPQQSLAKVAILPGQLEVPELSAAMTLNDPGHQLLVNGQVFSGSASKEIRENGTYAYTGAATPVEGPYFAHVIDPNLPGWIRKDLDAFLPSLLGIYNKQLGAPSGGRPMALIAWGGAERDGYSQSGSVLPGMVVMTLSGKQNVTPDPRVQAALRSFFGHEVGHFWLGQTVGYQNQDDSWITEGGADYLAVTATKLIDQSYDQNGAWQRQLDDCLARLGPGEPLIQAVERGDDRARYSCGSLLFLAANSAAHKRNSSSNAFTFARQIMSDNRDSGTVTEVKWLKRFAVVGGADLAGDVRDFIELGSSDPVSFWERLFAATAVPYHRTGAKLSIGPMQ